MKRRKFINHSLQSSFGMLIAPPFFNACTEAKMTATPGTLPPIAISTWNVERANAVAGKALQAGKNALDAAIEGASIEEVNKSNTTVGWGGAPDRDGNVSLDACVMDSSGNCGAVLAVRDIVHVAALAKEVMEKTPHVILAGEGARKFAIEQGFKTENLLTEESKIAWQKWLEKGNYSPEINVENHDTIGMLCRDQWGNFSGVCTTSGLAYKMMGRVGDSPIIGSGLFVDNEVGGAVATGMGEEVIKTVGSFLIVELMRQGKTPQEACEEAIGRIIEKQKGKPAFQVAYIAMDKSGATGAYSVHSGFSYMKYKNDVNQNIISNAKFKS